MSGQKQMHFYEERFRPYDVNYQNRVCLPDGTERWVVRHRGGAALLWAADSTTGRVLGYTLYHDPEWQDETGECWCPTCHQQMPRRAEDRLCPACGAELDASTAFAPSLEASYDYSAIPLDDEWCYA